MGTSPCYPWKGEGIKCLANPGDGDGLDSKLLFGVCGQCARRAPSHIPHGPHNTLGEHPRMVIDILGREGKQATRRGRNEQ